MAISRSLMNRQLRADGGIMQVTPREKFGLGSKLKKFVRKIIPNEVSAIAVKAAPFVAPFNPLLAAAMAGIGSFDQTGRIGSSLKRGALTYGMGQGARYLGGADIQGMPKFVGGEGLGGNFGFSKPTGSGGIKNLFKDKVEVSAVKGLGEPRNIEGFLTQDAAKNVGLESKRIADLAAQTQNRYLGNVTSGSARDSFNILKSFNTSAADKGKAALDLLKRGSKAMFYTNGKLDKAAVIGAVTAATTYAEALILARNAGVELTKEEYDQAQADEKKAEYADYLKNFFGGKKDGGRIGFESGANEMIKDQLMEDIMGTINENETITIMTENGPIKIPKSLYESMPQMFMDTTTSGYGDAGRGREVPPFADAFADGGRIGFRSGTKPEDAEVGIMTIDVEAGDDEDEEDMMMAYSDAIFDRREKGALFKALGDPNIRQTTKAFKNLNNILKNPGMFPEDEFILKEFLKLKGFKDGGRIGFESGANEMIKEKLMMELGLYPSPEEEEDSEIIMTKEGPVSIKEIFERDTPETEGKFGLSEGFTLSPVTLLRRYLANKELENRAQGGRIGYKGGANRVSELLILRDEKIGKGEDVSDIEAEIFQLTGKTFRSVGGISDIPTGKMRKNNAGVVERDYRDEGGFVPVGIKERADDVPAMLSKNEFVMTADAVRGIGNGSVEEGSKKLYNTMKKAEQVGKA